MALQFRRGTAADVASESFVPEIGEPVYLTDEQKLYVGDGVTQGGVSVAGATDIQNLSSVDLVSEGVGSIASYQVSSNTVTISLSLSHDYYVGLQVVIAGSPVTALNGTHTITELPAASQFAFLLTTADVANTVTTGSVTPKVPNGAVLQWNQSTSKWEDGLLELDDLSDVDLTTAPTTGQILSYDGTNFVPDDFEVVNDTTPQLGGNLDVNGNDIVSVSGGNIGVAPDGTGALTVKGNATGGSGKIALNCEQNTHAVTIQGPAHSAAATYTLTLPVNTGIIGDMLVTNGSGVTSWAQAATKNIATSFTFDYGGTAPVSTIANSTEIGRNWGTWTETSFANGNGPSSADFDPLLTGVTFNSSTGAFTGLPASDYFVTADVSYVINNVTPAIGNEVFHYLFATNTLYSYIGNPTSRGVLPYASYGSAAFSDTVSVSMYFAAEDATPANNALTLYGDQNMGTTYYVTYAKLTIVNLNNYG